MASHTITAVLTRFRRRYNLCKERAYETYRKAHCGNRTGGGLGFAYAGRLAREGASVVIADIDATLGADATARLTREGLDVRFVETDISLEASVASMARAAHAGTDGIHGLVANAGWANSVGGKAYDEISVETWDRMMATNVRGTWLTVRAVAPLMCTGGSIVTVSSDAIYWGAPLLLHYVTSKSAMSA